MDEKKTVNLEEDLTTEHTNEPVSLEEQVNRNAKNDFNNRSTNRKSASR